jgi:hypothetical protein
MKENKTAALSLRLPADLMQLLDERASAEHLTRTDIALAALREYLGVATAPAASDKLDRVIELLEPSPGMPHSVRQPHHSVRQCNTLKQHNVTRRQAMKYSVIRREPPILVFMP